MELLCVALAAVFAVLAGANDGCPILATGLSVSRSRPVVPYLLLVTAVVGVPLLGAVRVATTFTERMIRFSGPAQDEALAGTILAALVSVLLLTWRGLPTSLTLALIGSLTATGLSSGLAVSWQIVLSSLAVAALAPFVAGLIARLCTHGWRRRTFGASAANLHWLSFPAQAAAYAVNDAQKMLALMVLALGGTTTDLGPAVALVTAACFGVGIALGWRRFIGGVANSVLPLTPESAVVTEGSSAIAVTISAALGAPVSMTQSIMGAMVGSGTRHTWRRVRWASVRNIGTAWVLTLPVSGLVAVTFSMLRSAVL